MIPIADRELTLDAFGRRHPNTDAFVGSRGRAHFSPGRQHRYLLERSWSRLMFHDERARTIGFVGINPSVADESRDDPTVRLMVNRAQAAECSRLLMGNLWGLVDSDPAALKGHDDPVGSANDAFLGSLIAESDIIMVAWGDVGGASPRSAAVLDMIRRAGKTPLALGVTRAGHPWHPLRKAKALQLRPLDELRRAA